MHFIPVEPLILTLLTPFLYVDSFMEHIYQHGNKRNQKESTATTEAGMRRKREGRGGQTDRDDVKREPLTPPKVESATEMGMIHDITPSNFSPNVWEKY